MKTDPSKAKHFSMADSMQLDDQPQPLQGQALPFQNQRGPIKPEDVLAQLQRLYPGMMAPFPNEQGVLCIKLNELYIAACGIQDTTARGKRNDLLDNHSDFCKQYVSEMRVHKIFITDDPSLNIGGPKSHVITIEGMMILLQRMPRSSFAQAFQQATAMWNVDSMAGTADAVNYVQRNAADPSREGLRKHVENRNANGGSEIRISQPVVGGEDLMMLDVSDEQVERMKMVIALRNQALGMQSYSMLLQSHANDPVALERLIRYREAIDRLTVTTDPDEISLLRLSIQNELRLRNNIAPYAPVDRSGMKTVMEFIVKDDDKNMPYAKEIGREMAKLYRGRYGKEPASTDIDPATGYAEKMYQEREVDMFQGAKAIVLAKKSRGLQVGKGQSRINWQRSGN